MWRAIHNGTCNGLPRCNPLDYYGREMDEMRITKITRRGESQDPEKQLQVQPHRLLYKIRKDL